MTFLLHSLLLSLISCGHSQYTGDSCTANNGPGICQSIGNCKSVADDLLAGRPPSSVCGYEHFDPIVCCPLRNGPTTKPTQRPWTPRPTTKQPPVTESSFRGRGQIARAKCAEYSKAVYQLVTPPILVVNPTPINVSTCAIETRTLIVGGKKADLKEFPHMAAIGYSQNPIQWFCAGTLISERFVLSAAHCTYHRQWGNARIARLGDLNLHTDSDGAQPQDIRIIQRIKYPQYEGTSNYHDIVLFQLERVVRFNAFIRPACLPYSVPDIGTDGVATATGWGVVDWDDEEGSSDLLEVTLDLISQQRCNRTYGDGDRNIRMGIMGEWQICAYTEGKDTCQGDSGGPLSVINKDNYCMYNVIGITSTGRVCGSITPGIYTRVYYYIPWIESIVWADS